MSDGSSFTQTIATATLAGVVALAGTNMQTRDPFDAFALHYASSYKQDMGDLLINSVPTRTTRFADIEVSRSDSRWQKYVHERIEELRGRGR